ncbi:NucA/NucB deoxyribonuclease domain-containing protein [Actinomadura formosensis]|uniref:NucA/NucB deoxyribonuclease domain-containing protein n=1 Tax=Actinomadura formosensis TaxID=60706 RepID=UPI003D8FA510
MFGLVPTAVASPTPRPFKGGIKVSEATMHWLHDDGTGRKLPDKPLTPKQVEQEAHRRGTTYTADADKYASPRSPRRAADYDYISPQECRANTAESGKPGGWVKNHFAWCGRLAIGHRAKVCDPQNQNNCRIDGLFEAVYTVIGYGAHTQVGDKPSKTDRYINFAIWVDEIRLRSGVYQNPQSTMDMGIRCITQDAPRNCHSNGANGAKRTLDQWQNQKDTYVELISPGLEPIPANGEQFRHADIAPVSIGETPGYPPSTGEQVGTSIRFDSMWYNQKAKRGSIFTVVEPFLRFSRAGNTGYKAVAEHLWTALNRPQDTKPPFTDKQLPGKSIGNPLHRLVPSYSKENESRSNSNRYYAKAWGCNPYFPGWNSAIEYPPEYPQGRPVNECDEYPFASTYEGAARWKTDGAKYKNMFSARPVYWRENGAAGNVLAAWYDWDRIAEKEAYYIKVE